MKLKAKDSVNFDVISQEDDQDSPSVRTSSLVKDEVIDINIVEETAHYYQEIEFPNGSVAFGLSKKDWEKVY